MTAIHLSEQLAFLRKQKGVTQEELASALGVTNQAVSKWENGAACPDITLLPALSEFFGVSVDHLLGCAKQSSLADVSLRVKALFEAAPPAEAFDLAYRLAFALHEGAASGGYRERLPWVPRVREDEEDFASWGYSARSEPEGTTIQSSGTTLIHSTKYAKMPTHRDIKRLQTELAPLLEGEAMSVLFALTNKACTAQELARQAALPLERVEEALKRLPVEATAGEDGTPGYRIEGCAQHILPVLLLLIQR